MKCIYLFYLFSVIQFQLFAFKITDLYDRNALFCAAFNTNQQMSTC